MSIQMKLFAIVGVHSLLLYGSNTSGQETKPATILFARDIAPILVANCLECHNDQQSRGSLSMATPAKLMAGGESGVVIEPGQADKSLLVRHIRGDEQPLMPNNRRALALETIDTIARWVAAGAKLDEGQAAEKPMRELAWSAERIARDRVSRLSADERLVAEKKALSDIMAKIRPTAVENDLKTIATSAHFGVIGVAEKAAANGMLDSLEKARNELAKILGQGSNPLEKDFGRELLFVFERSAEFVEFQRQNGFELLESTVKTVGRIDGEWPVMAILVDPLALDASAPKPVAVKTSGKAKSKAKNTKNVATTPGFRSVDALATEAFAKAVLESYRTAPAWLKIGIPTLLAEEYDSDKGYYQSLLSEARAVGPGRITGGWEQRSEAFLKDQLPPQVATPLAYSLAKWLKSTQGSKINGFVQAATGGEPKLNEIIQKQWNVDRKVFIANWTNWLLRAGGTTGKKGR